MTIGFIGLGTLGLPIAENLLGKGHALYVYNRTASKAEPLKEKGAVTCFSVAELAKASDIVFSIVSDDAALQEITEGEDGIAANLKAGGIHASISTILPATAKELSELHQQHKNHYIASPVMGRPEAARVRKLNFLVSGNKSVIEILKPFLHDAGAAGVWEMGDDVAAANTAKLCSNFLIVSSIEAMAEGINLAQRSGLDPQVWMNMLTQTIFNAPAYINYGNLLLKKAYHPAGFFLRLGLKDVNLVLKQAESTDTKMPLGDLVKQHLAYCMEAGLGDHDLTAMAMAVK
jgi:3-hydroxyisobutyrate dehydrogenase-like beta-hydroxyacid dehydrogenase